MFGYCFYKNLTKKAVIFAVFLVYFLLLGQRVQANTLFEPCGPGEGICDTGLVCVEVEPDWRECRGSVGFFAGSVDECSPELIWVNGRCQVDLGEEQGEELGLGETTADLRDIIRKGITIALGFVAVGGVIMLIYAGFLWMFSAGREEQVTRAKQTILWTTAGLLVIMAAGTVTSYILQLGGDIGGGGGAGRGSGPPGGIPPGGGLVEEFKIIDVVALNESKSPQNEDLYQCTSLDTIFNDSIDDGSFASAVALETAALHKLRVVEREDGCCASQGDYLARPDVSWPAGTVNGFNLLGSHLEYTHFMPEDCPACSENDYLFPAGNYSLLVPLALKSLYGDVLAACEIEGCSGCCQKFSDIIVWDFMVGDKSDLTPPEISSASPYYDKDFYEATQGAVEITRNVQQQPEIVIRFSEGILASSVLNSYSATIQAAVESGGDQVVAVAAGEEEKFSVGEHVLVAHSETAIIKNIDTLHHTLTMDLANDYLAGDSIDSYEHPQADKFILQELKEMQKEWEEDPSLIPDESLVDGDPTTPAVIDPLPNYNFLAEFFYSNSTLVLTAISPAQAYLLKNNTWYRLTLKEVWDLCGKKLKTIEAQDWGNHTVYWLFQVNGLSADLYPTPTNGSEKICTDVEVGVSATVSLQDPDPLKESCAVGEGYVESTSSLQYTASTHDLADLPNLDPVEWTAETRRTLTEAGEGRNDCRLYNFTPDQVDNLQYDSWYKAQVLTRYPKPDGGLLEETWYFKTATEAEVKEGDCIDPPIIDRISPYYGPEGQCITIEGRNFGAGNPSEPPRTPDYGVYITPKGSEAALIPPNEPSIFFTEVGSWSDNIIVTTIPATPTADLSNFAKGTGEEAEHPVRLVLKNVVNPDAYTYSREYAFRLEEGDPSSGPCLYRVEPPDGHRGQTEILTGTRFGELVAATATHLVWYDDVDTIVPVGNWAPENIISSIPNESLLIISADGGVEVKVENDAGQSNPYPITLPKLETVTIFLRSDCDISYVSPNPQRVQGETGEAGCILEDEAGPYVPVLIEFNEDVDGDDSKFEELADYLKLYTCTDFSTCPTELVDYTIDDIYLWRHNPPEDPAKKHGVLEFKLRRVVPADIYGKIYQIVFSPIFDDQSINTPANFAGDTWKFKTMTADEVADGRCQMVDKVKLEFEPEIIKYPNDSTATATALNEQCQALPNVNFAWSARQPFVDSALQPTGEPVVELPASQYRSISIHSLNTAYLEAQAEIEAAVIEGGGVVIAPAGDGKALEMLTVRSSAYCDPNEGNDECQIAGCDGSECVKVESGIGRCSPYIRGVNPPSAAADEWVTVPGCYFGEVRGEMFFKQAEVTKPASFAFPEPYCQDTWHDTYVVTIVPAGLVATGEELPPDPPLADILLTTNQLYDELQSNDFSGLRIDEEITPRPMICAISPEQGGVAATVVLYGQDFNTDDPGNPGNEAVQFSRQEDFSETYVDDDVTITPLVPEGEAEEAEVPFGTQAGRNYVRATDAAGARKSNLLEFNVILEEGPAIISYLPLQNTIKPCADQPSGQEESYCFLEDKETGQVIVLEFSKALKEEPNPCQAITVKKRASAVTDFADQPSLEIVCAYPAGATELKFSTAEKLKVGEWQYQVTIDPQAMRDEQGRFLNCQAVPKNAADQCEWQFVVTSQINHIWLKPLKHNYQQAGQAEAGSVNTLTDSLLNQTDDQYWVDTNLYITAGPNVNEAMRTVTIFEPASDTITFTPAFSQPLGATSSYSLLGEDGIIYTRSYLTTKEDLAETFEVKAYGYEPVTITFLPDITSQTFPVSIINDEVAEADETFYIDLSRPTGGAQNPKRGMKLFILDDDDEPSGAGSLGFLDKTYDQVNENENGDNATIAISVIRTNGQQGEVKVDYAASSDEALVGEDYESVSGTLLFGDGERVQTFTVTVINDDLVEDTETIILELSNPQGGATLSDSITFLQIYDDDSQPADPGTFYFTGEYYAIEESAGEALVKLIRTGRGTGEVSIDYTFAPESWALGGLDFTGAGVKDIQNFAVERWFYKNLELEPVLGQGCEPGDRRCALQRVDNYLGSSPIGAFVGRSHYQEDLVQVRDPAALEIAEYYPAQDAPDVCRNTTISFTFNQAPTGNVDQSHIKLFTADGHCTLALGGDSSWFKRLAWELKDYLFNLIGRAEAEVAGSPCPAEEYKVEQNGRTINIIPLDPAGQPTVLSKGKEYTVAIFADNFASPGVDGIYWEYQSTPVGIDNTRCSVDGLIEGDNWGSAAVCLYRFTTSQTAGQEGICLLDHAAFFTEETSPGADLYLYKKEDVVTITAQGYSGDPDDYTKPIEPVEGLYHWWFKGWRHEPASAIIKLGDIENPAEPITVDDPPDEKDQQAKVQAQPLDQNGQPDLVNGFIKAGQTQVKVNVQLDAEHNQIKSQENIYTKPLVVEVRPCEGGADLWWGFEDSDPYSNFRFSYCRKTDANEEILPALADQPVVVTQPSYREVKREYFIRYQAPSQDGYDLFLIRVFPASDYFVSKSGVAAPLEEWYKENETLFEETGQFFRRAEVGGYEAGEVRHAGQSNVVYVQALNVDTATPRIYSNVYALAVNEGASEITQAIFDQLVENWEFNLNLLVEEDRDALKRDYQRIKDLSEVGRALDDYYSGYYPMLPDARVPGTAVSNWGQEWRWPSSDTKRNLGAALDLGSLPWDPQDEEKNSDLSTAAIVELIEKQCFPCEGYDQVNCPTTGCLWNPTVKICESSNVYECLWGQDGLAPQACLKPDDDFVGDDSQVTSADLVTISLGFGDNGINNFLNAEEIFECYDDEVSGKYYCRGEGSPVYQYEVTSDGGVFTLYANLEYNKDDMIEAWCQWEDSQSCLYWSGTVSFCKWSDENGCQKQGVVQPACAEGESAFNIMLRPKN